MEKGQMIEVPIKFHNEKVSKISKFIEDYHKIPTSRQIFIKPGGFFLNPDCILSSQNEGLDESNPIYIFTKTIPDEPPLNQPDLFELEDYDICDEINGFLSSFSNTQSFMKKLSTLLNLCNEIKKTNDRLLQEQITMVNGLQAASANLAEVDQDLECRFNSASKELDKFEENVVKWESSFRRFDKIKEDLINLPILPQLKDYIREETSIGKVEDIYQVFCNLLYPQIVTFNKEYSLNAFKSTTTSNVASMNDLRFSQYEKNLNFTRKRTISFGLQNDEDEYPGETGTSFEYKENLMNQTVETLVKDITYLRKGTDFRKRPDSVMILNPTALFEDVPSPSDKKESFLEFNEKKMNFMRSQINSLKLKVKTYNDSNLHNSKHNSSSQESSPNSQEASDPDENTCSKFYCDSKKMSTHLSKVGEVVYKSDQLLRHSKELHLSITREIVDPIDAVKLTQIQTRTKKIIENYKTLKKYLEVMCKKKQALADYIHDRQIWLQKIQSEITDIDKTIQRCFRRMKNITTFGIIFEHMENSPEIYIKCIVEIVRRREFDMKWHIWQNYYNSEAKKIQTQEINMRKQFLSSSNVSHPLIMKCFGFLSNIKISASKKKKATRFNNTESSQTTSQIRIIRRNRGPATSQTDESYDNNSISKAINITSIKKSFSHVNIPSCRSETNLDQIVNFENSPGTKKFGYITNEGRTDISPVLEMDSDLDAPKEEINSSSEKNDVNNQSRPASMFFEDANITLDNLPNLSNLPSLTRNDLKWLSNRLSHSFNVLLNESTKHELCFSSMNEPVLSTTSLASSNGCGSVLVKVHPQSRRKKTLSECNTSSTAPSSRLFHEDAINIFDKNGKRTSMHEEIKSKEASHLGSNADMKSDESKKDQLFDISLQNEQSPGVCEPLKIDCETQVELLETFDTVIQTESSGIDKSQQTSPTQKKSFVNNAPGSLSHFTSESDFMMLVHPMDLPNTPTVSIFGETLDLQSSNTPTPLGPKRSSSQSKLFPNHSQTASTVSNSQSRKDDVLMQSSFYSTHTYFTDNEFMQYDLQLNGRVSSNEKSPSTIQDLVNVRIKEIISHLKVAPLSNNDSIEPNHLDDIVKQVTDQLETLLVDLNNEELQKSISGEHSPLPQELESTNKNPTDISEEQNDSNNSVGDPTENNPRIVLAQSKVFSQDIVPLELEPPPASTEAAAVVNKSFTTAQVKNILFDNLSVKLSNFTPSDTIIIVPAQTISPKDPILNPLMTSSRVSNLSMIDSMESSSSFDEASSTSTSLSSVKNREIWRVLSDDGNIYILDRKCYKDLDIPNIMHRKAKTGLKKSSYSDDNFQSVSFLLRESCHVLAQFVSHVKMISQKNNKLGFPKNLVIYRVKAVPLGSISSPPTPTPTLRHSPVKTLREYATQTTPMSNSMQAKELIDYIQRKKNDPDSLSNPIAIFSLLPSSLNLTLKFFESGDVVAFIPISINVSVENLTQSASSKFSNAVHEIWRMLSNDENVYLLDKDDYAILDVHNLKLLSAKRTNASMYQGIESFGIIPINQRRYPFIVARFLAFEPCLITKEGNRYHLPKDFKFFKVRAQPLI